MFAGLELLEDNFPNKLLKEKIDLFHKNNNEENYQELIKELERSIFLFPILSETNNITGFVLNKVNNNNYISVFSNMDEFDKWYKDYQLNFMFYSINEICSIINDDENTYIDGFIIDPYGLNMIFDKNLIKMRNFE